MIRSEEIVVLNNLRNYYSNRQGGEENAQALDFAISSLLTDEAYQLEYEPTTKNDLGVDCIVDVLGSYTDLDIPYKHKIAEDILNNLPSVTSQSKWIPVSEKLPENKETVLVTFKHFVSGNIIGLGSVILLRGKPHWHVREQNFGTYDVLAWMPLPPSYSEVEE